MSDQNESMLDIYIFETSQLTEQLQEIVLLNEKENCYTEDSTNEIFRIMHTIKGSSAMMMFENITSLAHAMEDLFFVIREDKPEKLNCSILTDIILSCIDFYNTEMDKIKNRLIPDGDNSKLLIKINNFLEDIKQTNMPQNNSDIEKVPESYLIDKSVYEMKNLGTVNCYKAILYFEDGIDMLNIHAYSIVNNLKKSQNEIYYIPSDLIENNESMEVIRKDGLKIYLKSEYSYEMMQQLLSSTIFLKELELTCLENEEDIRNIYETHDNLAANKEDTKIQIKQDQQINSSGSTIQNVSNQQSIISVKVDKLDKLMDLVGEMVIAEAMVIQNSDLNGLVLNNFNKAARQLTKITDEIQDVVMAVRMVPLSTTFSRMHRIVRDMSKKLGKEVNLEIIGEETEVDKNIIEHITDPLMHLVRNSMDHGIEMPEERIAIGKPQVGSIILEAKSTGSDVLILIKDDGKGLNKKAILQKAAENNLLSKPESDMTDKEIFNLILLPGFSTKKKITEYSGRGVGMDVVLKNIEMVGGSVFIDSIQQIGTTITLKIPLTLAIIDGMNIRVGNSHYTIPTVSIKEFFRPNTKDIIVDPDGNEMIMVRGQCYPILRLFELYNIKNAKTIFENGMMIMVEQEGKTICIFTDELLGQQQVVVKALPDLMHKKKNIKGISGCTLLGDGSISLILDIAGLVA